MVVISYFCDADSSSPHSYICSRIYLHSPPGDVRELHLHPDAPAELKEHAERLATTDPELNQWVCLAVLVLTIGIMAPTAEWVSFINQRSVSWILISH